MILVMASSLMFDDSCRHMVHQSLYFMLMSLIRVCLVFYFPLFKALLYRSLQTLVIMPHRCWKMTEVSNKIFLCSSFIVFPNSGRFSVYISIFLSLVEGDNLHKAVQETAQGNF